MTPSPASPGNWSFMSFRPPHCPLDSCRSSSRPSFRYRSRGSFRRDCDGRTVQRFLCLHCRRSFSTQTFRVDYRLRRPTLWTAVFEGLVSKLTLRQMARLRHCSRKSLALRLVRFGEHCRAFHLERLERAQRRGGLPGRFQLDELETYEHDRRLCPLSVPVLMERRSYFVVCAQAAPLPARGSLRPKDQERKEKRDLQLGVRRSGSRAAVARSFELLKHVAGGTARLELQTDEKPSYASEARRCFGASLNHKRYSSRAPRVHGSPLFPINHTLAQMRDSISRLVRRTWASSKRARFLDLHQWIWIAWRNYVRGITNEAPRTTPAMALRVFPVQLSISELVALRVFRSRST
jgi:transposase-like protein